MSALTIIPRVFHWDEIPTLKSKSLGAFNFVFRCHNCHAPRLLIVQAFLYTFFVTNTTDFPWHFLIYNTMYSGMSNVFFLGLQYVFFRVVVAAHFYYTFLITIPYILGYQTCFSGIAISVFLSDMPNVFFWDCNECFFRVIYNTNKFPIHNILVVENKKNSVCSINIFAACCSTRLRAYIFENYNQINLGLDLE